MSFNKNFLGSEDPGKNVGTLPQLFQTPQKLVAGLSNIMLIQMKHLIIFNSSYTWLHSNLAFVKFNVVHGL